MQINANLFGILLDLYYLCHQILLEKGAKSFEQHEL